VVSLPLQAASLADTSSQNLIFPIIVGASLYAVGLFFEVVGDWQLAKFRADKKNKDAVLDTGLWKYTRHPNYFGDFCVHWGLAVLCIGAGAPAWTLIGPILMTVLLLRVSGAALLERTIGNRRPGYERYVRQTSVFFPFPPKKDAKNQ
jgi:steroid 5-alpha reductase family enzyme